jgi:hypothetical protein
MSRTLEDQIRALADRSVGAVQPVEGVGQGAGVLQPSRPGSPTGGDHHRSRAWMAAAVALVVVASALATVVLWRDPEPAPVTTTPEVATTQPDPGLLDDATWQVSSGQSIDSSTDQVLVDVRSVPCHAGVATPYAAVEERGIEVIITATVDLTAGACIDDTTQPLQLLVQLPSPLGHRVLLDGACLPEGDLFRSAFCDDGQRWPDEPDPRVQRRPGGWQLGLDGVDASDSSFVVGVTRIECNGGQSGDVGRPTVELGASEVLVSFWPPPLTGDAPRTCPSNAPTVVEVDLGEPLGDRVLVDGGCLEDGRLPPNLCERWRP